MEKSQADVTHLSDQIAANAALMADMRARDAELGRRLEKLEHQRRAK